MKRLGLTIICVAAFFAIVLTVYSQMPGSHHTQMPDSHHDNSSCTDPGCRHHAQDIATVGFGAWMTSPALDRFPNSSPTRTANHHVMTPRTVTIRAGGMVNFVIAGLHQVIVYDNNSDPRNINQSLVVAPTGPGNLPAFLINDPYRRIYRGLDPSLQPLDRVEVVQFNTPGLYLVICGVLPHFRDGMFGYVRVVADE